MNRARWLAIGVAMVAALPAQRQQPEDQVRAAKTEIARKQRELVELKNEGESLLDMRLRHDLGLPVPEANDLFQFEGKVTSEHLDKQRRQLQEVDTDVSGLLQRYNKLKGQVEELRAAAAAVEEKQAKDRSEWVVEMPRAGDGGRRPDAKTPAARQPAPGPDGEARPSPAEAGHPETHGKAVVLPNLEPVVGQIQGTDDLGRIARALFRAGQALMDQAASMRPQQAAAADELDAKAKERLQKAVEVLTPMLTDKAAPLVDLFYLGKSREALFRLAEQHEGLDLKSDAKTYQRREQEVRDPFVTISSRDAQGTWGLAAQAALDHFRWMNLHGGFRPKTPMETITWEQPSK